MELFVQLFMNCIVIMSLWSLSLSSSTASSHHHTSLIIMTFIVHMNDIYVSHFSSKETRRAPIISNHFTFPSLSCSAGMHNTHKNMYISHHSDACRKIHHKISGRLWVLGNTRYPSSESFHFLLVVIVSDKETCRNLISVVHPNNRERRGAERSTHSLQP